MNFSVLKEAFQKNAQNKILKPESLKLILDDFGFEYNDLPLNSLSFEEYIEFVSKLKHENLFSLFQDPETSKISKESLKKLCKEIEWEIEDDEIEEMIQIGDLNKDGFLDKKEFFNLLKQNKM